MTKVEIPVVSTTAVQDSSRLRQLFNQPALEANFLCCLRWTVFPIPFSTEILKAFSFWYFVGDDKRLAPGGIVQHFCQMTLACAISGNFQGIQSKIL